MKRYLGLVLGLALAVSASVSAGEMKSASKWQMQIDGGFDVLASNFNTAVYSGGIGLGVGAGYLVNDNWSFWLNLEDYYLLSNSSGSTNNLVESVLSARYTFSGTSVKPYLSAGLGTFTQIASSGGYTLSSSDFMLQGKGGLIFPAGDHFSFYAEAKVGVILASVTAIDIPITGGVMFDL